MSGGNNSHETPSIFEAEPFAADFGLSEVGLPVVKKIEGTTTDCELGTILEPLIEAEKNIPEPLVEAEKNIPEPLVETEKNIPEPLVEAKKTAIKRKPRKKKVNIGDDPERIKGIETEEAKELSES